MTQDLSKFFVISALTGLACGCTNFNYPITGTYTFVVGATSSPRISIYRLANDKNSLVQLATLDPSFVPLRIAGGSDVLVFSNGTTMGTAVYYRGLMTAKTEKSGTYYGIGISPDGRHVYSGDGGANINVASLTNSTLPSSVTQSFNNGAFGDTLECFRFSSDGTRLLVSDEGGGDLNGPHMVARDASTGLISSYISALIVPGGSPMSLDDFSALGADYFVGTEPNTLFLYRISSGALSSPTSLATGVTATGLSTHPTQPWVFVSTSTDIRRYTATTTSLAFASSTSTTGTSLGIIVDSSGDRLVHLTASALSLYGISSTGALTLITTTSLTNTATVLAKLPMS